MKVKLVSIDPWSPALEFVLDSWPVTLGRDGQCDIRIDERWISHPHCELNCSNGSVSVRDIDSKHGTLVNGQPVGQAVLNSGDTLTVGIRSFRVTYRRSNRTKRTKRTDSGSDVQEAVAVVR